MPHRSVHLNQRASSAPTPPLRKMLSAPTRLRADILVASEDGTNRLLIEVKRLESNELLAANTFHQRAAALVPGCFLLFVSTRKFWLWAPTATAPTHEGDTVALLRRYLDLDRVPLASLTGQELDLVVYSWVSSQKRYSSCRKTSSSTKLDSTNTVIRPPMLPAECSPGR